MKAMVQDPTVLRAVQPVALANYLRARGWRSTGDYAPRATLWIWDRGDADVLVPHEHGNDFALRIGEALGTIAEVEGRSQLEVLRDVLRTASDVVRLRATPEDAADGTLALPDAVAFVESAQQLFLAAACATVQKRPQFATRKPRQAVEFVDRLRMGQTEIGSFVLTILSPVPPQLAVDEEAQLFPVDPPPPFERQVTKTLFGSLAAMTRAAQRAAIENDMRPFQDSVAEGVSANLCDAVVELSRINRGRPLSIDVVWSTYWRPEQAIPQSVRLLPDTVPAIAEAARIFRALAPDEDAQVEGAVVHLMRPERQVEGEVVIVDHVGGKTRSVTVELSEPDYREAIRAHQEHLVVSCEGELVRDGRRYRLRNPRRFTVLPPDE